MYLWSRRAGASWLAAHERDLEKSAAGRIAVIELPGHARQIVQVVCDSREPAAALRERFGGSTEILRRDWAEKYLKPQNRAPLRIGRRLVIFSEFTPNEMRQLVIPAAGAFGTGDHATTAMCLRLLEETTRKLSLGWRLLDAGTGTGILALAARRFGASEVLGVDFDPAAVAHARGNARFNKIGRAQFVRADVLTWKPPHRFEIITANLFSELLTAAVPKFRRALKPHGRLILSGILREQADGVVSALHQSHLVIEKSRRRGKWIALLAACKT